MMSRVRGPRLLIALLTLGSAGFACNAQPTAGGSDASTGADAPGSGEDAVGSTRRALPCDVDQILESRCRGCHSDPPRFGAPMPLVAQADFHAPAKSDPAKDVYQLAIERLADPVRPMPPGGDLPPSERSVLEAWLSAGAPEGSCGAAADAGVGPAVGPEALPCTPSHTFTAHASNSTTGRFPVPPSAGNLYECFTFRSPFNGTEQGIAWAPITDDDRVLHHWILYRTETAQPDNGVMNCQMPRDAIFVAGWAPGGKNFVMPDDIGLELPGPSEWLILQVHYHNVAGYTDANDASGVALCTTPAPRANTAGVYTLGTYGINIPAGAVGYEASHTCGSALTSRLPEPIHILASFPHMHQLGRRFRTEILRGSNTGPSETLVDVPRFNFEDQRNYVHEPPVTLNPGDAIRTTCVYDNPGTTAVRFGERTEDEMCFNFAMVYPIEIFPGRRTCVGL